MSAGKSTLCLAVLLLSCACSSGASDDPAFDARMRVAGAQFVRGATPAAEDGPEVASVLLPTDTIWPGFPNKAIQGALGETATAAALAMSGDNGYWIVRADVPDVSAPTLPTFRATAGFALSLQAGEYTLQVRAVDADRRFGPRLDHTLTSLAAAPQQTSSGALVVSLRWDTESDLDLHVVEPSGNEIFHAEPTSAGSAASSTPNESVGVLDGDSNADCALDGRRQEDVTWAENPGAGHYWVRVDTPNLCDAPNAHWDASVRLDGALIAHAQGTALDSDTWGTHDRGAGTLALGFDVP